MCVLYVSFGCKLRPRTFGCVAMRSAVLFIFRSRVLLYSVGFGVNRVQVVLSRFSVILFCFVQAKSLCRYGYMYVLVTLVLVCVDRTSWYGVGSWPSNRATERSNPKGIRLYFVILLKNVEQIFDWH